jgi:hypothetical protein
VVLFVRFSQCGSIFREGLEANGKLLVNLQGLEDAAQLKIETENSNTVVFIDGSLSARSQNS